jgi:hypothetical protein
MTSTYTPGHVEVQGIATTGAKYARLFGMREDTPLSIAETGSFFAGGR